MYRHMTLRDLSRSILFGFHSEFRPMVRNLGWSGSRADMQYTIAAAAQTVRNISLNCQNLIELCKLKGYIYAVNCDAAIRSKMLGSILQLIMQPYIPGQGS